MAEYRLGRSEEGFDLTAHQALARLAKEQKHPRDSREPAKSWDDLYHGSPEDVARFTGVVVEPPILYPGRLRKQLRRFRYNQRLAARLRQGGESQNDL